MITNFNIYLPGSTAQSANQNSAGNAFGQSQNWGDFGSNYQLASSGYTATPQNNIYSSNFNQANGNSNIPVKPLFYGGNNSGYNVSTQQGTTHNSLFGHSDNNASNNGSYGNSIVPGNHTKPAFGNGNNTGPLVSNYGNSGIYGNHNPFNHLSGGNPGPIYGNGGNSGYGGNSTVNPIGWWGNGSKPTTGQGGNNGNSGNYGNTNIVPGNNTKPAFGNGNNTGPINGNNNGNSGNSGNYGNNNPFNHLSGGNPGPIFGNNSNNGNYGNNNNSGNYGNNNNGWNNTSNFTKNATKVGNKADKPFSRLTDANYDRSKDANLPGAREVSNAVAAQSGETQNKNGASDLLWTWGQFIDHDITLSSEGTEKGKIAVPKGDAGLDPTGTGEAYIPITESEYKTNKNGVKQQLNGQTPFIDGSQVYGATDAETTNLREGTGGRLRLEDGFLPTNSDPHKLVDSGDPRAAEQPGLLSLQTLFAREHNRIADKISTRNPSLSDDKIFDKAQKQVKGQIQSITYNEFLPTFIGDKRANSTAYSGNLDKVDGKISNEFASAAFRVGHTLVSEKVATKNADGSLTTTNLDDVFFKPEFTTEKGIGSVLAGFSEQTAEKVDPEIVDSLRNRLFGAPGSPGMDLAALNIERGREHGLPTYNDMREALGYRAINSFNDPIFQNGYGDKLAEVYDSPDQIDLWVGGLAENAKGDSMLGQTFTKIVRDQFTNLRAADQNFYSNSSSNYSQRNIDRLDNTTLADIIRRNTDDSFNIDDTPFIATDNTQKYYS